MATIAFDLNGTLLDPAHLGETPDDEPLVLRALDLAIAQAMTLTFAGAYRPFKELLAAGLRYELEVAGRDPDRADDWIERTATMPAFPKVPAALDHLRGAGHTLVVLTNSARAAAETALDNAGIGDRFAAVRGTDEVRAFKPDPRVYALAADADWLVAAHWWDVHGARAAGMRGAWVARKERVLVGTAEAQGEDVLAVARAITG